MKSVSSLEVSAGMVISISPEVYALAEEHKAEAIWVRAGYDNQFTAVLENGSPSHVSGQFHYGIEDVNTGRLEKERFCCLIHAGPGDKFEFSGQESDLPSPGVKRIIGRTDNPNIRCNSSGNIIVANPEDVYTE